MPSYPNSIPVLPTLTSSDYPRARDINIPNREIEAICTELGLKPKEVSGRTTHDYPDSVPPSPVPASVAAYLDMLANIVQNLSGKDDWYDAAVPNRCLVSGHGGATVIPAGATRYLQWFGRGLSTSAGITRLYLPWNANLQQVSCQIITAQPASGSLSFAVYIGTTDTGISFTIAADSPALTIDSAEDLTYSYPAGYPLVVAVTNNASVDSAEIGGFSAIFNQVAQ